jgi:hypothetical protein
MGPDVIRLICFEEGVNDGIRVVLQASLKFVEAPVHIAVDSLGVDDEDAGEGDEEQG